MNTTNRPATPLPWRTEYGVNIIGADGKQFDDREVGAAAQNAAYIVHACNAYPKLMDALRALLIAAETRPVLAGDGVKAVREAGKFKKAIDTARAVLAECEEG